MNGRLKTRGREVALIFNLKDSQVVEDDEPPDLLAELDTIETIEGIAGALQNGGHRVVLLEADRTLPEKLVRQPVDLAFNIAEGLRGPNRESQVPAVLEMLGIPYTGSDPLSLGLCLNKPLCKILLEHHGLPTPRFTTVSVGSTSGSVDLRFPLFVKPAMEGSSKGISPRSIVTTIEELETQVALVHRDYRQPALVEEFIDGREFTVGILGNPGKGLTLFPITEINFGLCPPEHKNIYSYQFKKEWDGDEYYLCPAPVTLEEEELLYRVALKAFEVLGCRDLCRVDIRMSSDGIPYVLELNPLPGLTPGFSDYPRMAAVAGYSFEQLINSILETAAERAGLTVTGSIMAVT